MEADGSSGNFCSYCSKPGHKSDQCREKSADRRSDIALGVGIGCLLVPFAILGYVLGSIAGCVWGGISHGFKNWENWVAYLRGLFGKSKS